MPPEVISAIWQGDKAMQDREVPWVAALQSNVNDARPEGTQIFSPDDIQTAQKEDPSVAEVIQLKKQDGIPRE